MFVLNNFELRPFYLELVNQLLLSQVISTPNSTYNTALQFRVTTWKARTDRLRQHGRKDGCNFWCSPYNEGYIMTCGISHTLRLLSVCWMKSSLIPDM